MTFASRLGIRWASMKAKMSAVATSAGSLGTTEKHTLRSNAVASAVFGQARARTKARYASTNGWPSLSAATPPASGVRMSDGDQANDTTSLAAAGD